MNIKSNMSFKPEKVKKLQTVTDIGSGIYRMINTIRERLNKEIKLNATESD